MPRRPLDLDDTELEAAFARLCQSWREGSAGRRRIVMRVLDAVLDERCERRHVSA